MYMRRVDYGHDTPNELQPADETALRPLGRIRWAAHELTDVESGAQGTL